MRTSGRCPVSSAGAGAAAPGPGGPGAGVYRTGDRAPSARPAGLRRIAVRRRAPCAASCQVRPRTSRTGRPRPAGMTAMPAPGPCSRSCWPGWPVSGRTRAARRRQPGPGPAMPEHNLVRSHCSPVFPAVVPDVVSPAVLAAHLHGGAAGRPDTGRDRLPSACRSTRVTAAGPGLVTCSL
jgi:hypothetical protein